MVARWFPRHQRHNGSWHSSHSERQRLWQWTQRFMTHPLDTQTDAAEAGGLPLHSTLAVSQQTTPPRLQTSENAPAQGHRVGWLRESGQGNRACFRASFASLQAQDTPQSPPGHQGHEKTSSRSYNLLLSGWPTIDPPQVSHLFIALTLVRVLLGPAQDVGVVLPFLCAFLFDHEVMPAIQSQSFVIHQASSTTTLDSMTVPRSEEHTSELQSHSDLVCRLLLVQ